MPTLVTHIAMLPVVELSPRGQWLRLGTAHDVTLRQQRYGRGFRWQGQCRAVELAEPGIPVEVLRWQTDRIIVQRIARD